MVCVLSIFHKLKALKGPNIDNLYISKLKLNKL